MNLKLITRHRGSIELCEYGYHTRYRQVDEHECVRTFGADPMLVDWCVAKGEAGVCEECVDFLSDGCVGTKICSADQVRKMFTEYEHLGYPYMEDHGEIVMDVTGHEPSCCDQHPNKGCIVCYPGCGEEHEEE